MYGQRQVDLGQMCEEQHEIMLFGGGMGNIQRCVEGPDIGQTSNPSLAWKK